MKPNLRPTRISKHAAEFAGAAGKSAARKIAQKTGGPTSLAEQVASAADKAASALSKAGGPAANAKGPSPTAPTWDGDISKAIANESNPAGGGSQTSQAETWMAVEQMTFFTGGGSGGSTGGGNAPAPSFTSADQAAVIEAVKAGVKHAVDMWKVLAHFTDLKINALSAIGTPGCLDGPSLEPHIRSHTKVQSLTGPAREMANGIAEGFSDCFFLWQDAVTVPGLPWYPAFVAWPGPAAPPTPNITMPLTSCVSSKVSKLLHATEIADAIEQALPASLSGETDFINRVATGLALGASMWLPAVQVTNVLGFGPVPTFAPPYVPVGSVVMGTNIPAPGHFASAPQFSPLIF
jgi:hypothetical protein